MVQLTQKNFNIFCEALNHRMTRIEGNVAWLKWIVGYMAIITTAATVKALIGL